MPGRIASRVLCAVLSCGAGNALAADASINAAAEWNGFLATANATDAINAYDVLDKVDYDGEKVDAAACTAHSDAMAKAIATVPISLAIRRADYLCAQATGDGGHAEQAIGALLALSREALSGSGNYYAGKPIRVLAPADATALVLSSGMEVAYLYYPWLYPKRYFPLVIAARDPKSGVERHLAFDFVDASYTIDRKDPMSGFPILRNYWATGYIQNTAKQRQSFAQDIQAVRKANAELGDAKLAALREGAAVGGVESIMYWLEVCEFRKTPHCGDGLVDALLPGAEKHYAYPLLLLAMAHLQGIGVERDPKTAWALLDDADRHWQGGGAIEQFTRILFDMDDKASLPAPLVERLERAAAQGNHFWKWRQIEQAFEANPKAPLDADQIAFLSDPARNELGEGEAELSDRYDAQGDTPQMLAWMRKAAEAGSAGAQARYGYALDAGDYGLTRDHAAARQMLERAAHGGATDAMRRLASWAERDGRWSEAEKWRLAAAAVGDVDALMGLAELYVDERPGVSGNLAQGVDTYRDLDRVGVAQGRRALARLALEGRGMPKDPQKAKAWLLADAQKGDVESERQLAQGYLNGNFGTIDEAEGVRWMEQAIGAGSLAAMNNLASWLYHQKASPTDRKRAVELWLKGDASNSQNSRNDYAWALCTGEDADLDAPLALKLLSKIGTREQMDTSIQDTLAACYAASGDFVQATLLQADVIAQVEQLTAHEPTDTRAKRMKAFQDRLALYKASKRYRIERSPASKPNISESVTTSPTKKR
jgi:TPR repeat protein